MQCSQFPVGLFFVYPLTAKMRRVSENIAAVSASEYNRAKRRQVVAIAVGCQVALGKSADLAPTRSTLFSGQAILLEGATERPAGQSSGSP